MFNPLKSIGEWFAEKLVPESFFKDKEHAEYIYDAQIRRHIG